MTDIDLKVAGAVSPVKYDGSLMIAVGNSRTSKSWKNKTYTWAELVEKLSLTTRTPETILEYGKMSVDEKAKTKDVGGFVGGTLKGGRRKAENVAYRQLLTLDLDYAGISTWDAIKEKIPSAALLYSTHSHTPDKPRFRLIIPLDRPVKPEEYQAIGRKIAERVGIDMFDDTTYEPSRLMYWPSTSCDGEYIFRVQDQEWMSADSVLSEYPDWRDVSYWPESSRAKARVMSALKRQEDPENKRGIIGAFCRTYTITEVIEKYLSEVYGSCDLDDRYTYLPGSTSGGVVIYEDKFAYSHHGTDPASMTLCNAFDLVRVHLFGYLDEDLPEKVRSDRIPSYIAMRDFAAEDEAVKKQLGLERRQAIEEEFGELIDIEDGESWESALEVDKNGNPLKTTNNILLILECDPVLKGKIAYNAFSNRGQILGPVPWDSSVKDKRDWVDNDDSGLRHYLEKYYGLYVVNKTNDALETLFKLNSFHPIKDYLEAIDWDGVERVDTLLIDYLGAEDSQYVREVTRKTLLAAVTRIYEPGCKFDETLTLVGPQGIGKSTLASKLGGEWFSDSLTTIQGKEAYEQLPGNWILEIAELNAMRKSEVNAVKLFLSKQEDVYRVAYGRRTQRFPRQCVFISTTNDYEFLRDNTGERRFWPVDVTQKATKNVWTDLDDYTIRQIWAEVCIYYEFGEELTLSKEAAKTAIEMQQAHKEHNTKKGAIEEFVEKKITDDWYKRSLPDRRAFLNDFDGEGNVQRDKICAIEIYCELFGGQIRNMKQSDTREINSILATLDGWERHKSSLRFGPDYGLQRCFVRKKASTL